MSGITKLWGGIGPINLVLTPLSGLYALGWRTYEWIYASGLKVAKSPHPRIVCVGNLASGGTGKTPLTIAVATILANLGYSVMIGMSGYGSPRSRDASLSPSGPLAAQDWGDEPAVVRHNLPQVPLVVGRDRVLAAQLAYDADPQSVLLMDDGFQHLPLKKDISILLDPHLPNRFCFPAGPMREPRSGLARADVVLPSPPIDVQFTTTFECVTGERRTRDRAIVLTAIANPLRFVEAVQSQGIEIAEARLLPDHSPLNQSNLFESLDPALPIYVTLKDWVKLRDRDDLHGRNLWVGDVRATIVPEDDFSAWLDGRLKQIEA